MNASVDFKSKTAIAGLGITEMGKIYGRSNTDFAVEAIGLAIQDAGLRKDEVDGILINAGIANLLGLPNAIGLELQHALGLTDLRLLNVMNGYGSTVGAMVQYASMAIASGMAEACGLRLCRCAAGARSGGRRSLYG